MRPPRSQSPRGWIAFAAVVALAAPGADARATSPQFERPIPTHWDPRTYRCVRVTTPIQVDGRCDPGEWGASPWTEPFVDIANRDPAPALATRARIAWDATYLYVAAELEEPDIWASLAERDAYVFNDDDFEIFIDTDGSTHSYCEIEINALGTVWDLFLARPYRDGGPALHGWNVAGLRSAVAVDGTLNAPGDRDAGWSVELAIPWTALNEGECVECPPQVGDRWRINFARVDWECTATDAGTYERRTDPASGEPLAPRNWAWSPQRAVDMHEPEFWAIVEFVDGVSPADEPLVPNASERAGWALRCVYYAEHARRARTGGFVGWDALAVPPLEIPAGWQWPPNLVASPTGFHAAMRGPGDRILTIGDSGGLRWADR